MSIKFTDWVIEEQEKQKEKQMIMDRDSNGSILDEVQRDSRQRSATYIRKKALEKETGFCRKMFRICGIISILIISLIVTGIIL